MKLKLIALLKTSFANKGFNAKELESLADLIISQQSLTDESADEDLNTAVANAKPVADFVQSVASRQVSDVKKPKPAETATNPEEEGKTETGTDEMPAWAKDLVASTQALAQGLQAIQGEKVASTRREQFIKSMEGTSPEYQARELKRFDRISFKDDADFTSFMEEIKADHAAAVQEDVNAGLGGERPVGGVGGSSSSTKKEATEAEVEAAFANLKI